MVTRPIETRARLSPLRNLSSAKAGERRPRPIPAPAYAGVTTLRGNDFMDCLPPRKRGTIGLEWIPVACGNDDAVGLGLPNYLPPRSLAAQFFDFGDEHLGVVDGFFEVGVGAGGGEQALPVTFHGVGGGE